MEEGTYVFMSRQTGGSSSGRTERSSVVLDHFDAVSLFGIEAALHRLAGWDVEYREGDMLCARRDDVHRHVWIQPVGETDHDLADVLWCRALFASLTAGGVWGVPRSGLLFQKDGDRLVLTARMPYDPEMPITEDELREQQDSDVAAIRSRFELAGIDVVEQVAV